MSPGGSAGQEVCDQPVHMQKIGEFLALTFGLSWLSAAVLYLAGIELRTLRGFVLVTVLIMWAPAIATIVVQLYHGEPIRGKCGLRRGRPGWIFLAWVAPVAFVAATIAIGTALPGVTVTTDFGGFLLELGLTQEQADAAVAELESFPGPPAVVLITQGLIAGLTINALAALGEELGWRGLLLAELSPLGFWKLSGITGIIWGIWHAPVILQGHNFPDAPIAGILVMTVATVTLSPVYTYLTVRANSVLAATFFHGSFNGMGALALVYLTGAGNLLVSPVGIAGVGAALVAIILCLIHDQFIADKAITSGDPLRYGG